MGRLSEGPCAELISRSITIDGTDFALTVTPEQCRKVYLPVAELVLRRAEDCDRGRLIVGIAGPPGAGKSAFAAILAELLGILTSPEHVVAVPLDGFHYPNAYLDSHTVVDGVREVTLRSLKGRPCSFNAGAALSALREIRAGGEAALPAYSRRLHDPVDDAIHIGSEHEVVLFEGNFLLLDMPPWREMRELFDLTVFVTEEREVLERRLLARHRRGGSSIEEARAKIARVDGVNIDEVAASERFADVVVSPGQLGFEVRHDSMGTRRG